MKKKTDNQAVKKRYGAAKARDYSYNVPNLKNAQLFYDIVNHIFTTIYFNLKPPETIRSKQNQIVVLMALLAMEYRKNIITSADLADHLLIDRPSMSALLRRLERKKIIRRVRLSLDDGKMPSYAISVVWPEAIAARYYEIRFGLATPNLQDD